MIIIIIIISIDDYIQTTIVNLLSNIIQFLIIYKDQYGTIHNAYFNCNAGTFNVTGKGERDT